MPVIQYRDQNFRGDSLKIIEYADEICRDYGNQGYELTLRQLYYQFVARALVENTERSYKRIGSIINDARMAGLLDWSFITDRTRNLRSWSHWTTPAAAIRETADDFRHDVWEDQEVYIEVWVEKDALVDVVQRACWPTRAPHFSCRGYVSQSEMWTAGQRIRDLAFNLGRHPVILHLGDHDPSGLDMTRDIEDRVSLFAEGEVEVRRIALNMDQVLTYNPPPNPAKLTDSRGSSYVAEYGRSSWELDALDPAKLNELITGEIERLIDRPVMNLALEAERSDRERMYEISDRWRDLDDNWGDVVGVLDGE